MNLAAYLMAEVTPLYERAPTPEPKVVVEKPVKVSVKVPRVRKVRVTVEKGLTGNQYQHASAVARYKNVCTEEWTPTSVIQTRLGMKRSTVYKVLDKWRKLGIVERKVVPSKAFPFRLYEWRWL